MKITFIGDVMLGENLFHLGRGIKTRYKNNYENLLDVSIRQIFAETDILLYNMEYSIADSNSVNLIDAPSKVYRGDLESLNVFNSAKGIKVANIANNHFSQHGISSAIYTKNALEEKKILIVGNDNEPISINTQKEKIKIWGVSLISDPKYCGQYWLAKPEELINTLHGFYQSKASDELWILSIHWGNEYVEAPQSDQIDLASQILSNGIDIIAGHHPHVTQPIQRINEKAVIYSLGNFLFDQNFSKQTQEGLIVGYDTKNTKLLSVCKTFQSDYRISSIHEVTLDEFNTSKKKLDKNDISSIQKKFRVLMKLEFFKNIFKTDIDALLFFARKYLKI